MARVARWTATFLASGLLLSVAACSDPPPQPSGLSDDTSASQPASSGSAASGTSGSASDTSSTSGTSSPDEQAIIAQYKGYYNAIYTLTTPTDDDQVRAAFEPYAATPVVDNWVKVFAALNADNKRPSGGVQFGPIEVTVSAGTATTRECRDSTSELIVSSVDGATLTHGSPGTLVDGALSKDDSGIWRVTKAVAQESGC